MRRARALLAAALLPAWLAGCAGWPSRLAPTRLPQAAPLDDLGTAQGAWPDREWWRRYHDPTLDRLVSLALAHSPSIAVAQARFRAARRGVRVAAAAAGARVDLAGDVSRQRLSDTGLLPSALTGFSWYDQADLGLRGSYHFDWWGKQRDAVVAATDRARAAAAERAAAALDLSSAVADAYFGWQTDEARLRLARAALRTTLAARAITAARAHAGLDPRTAVHSADLRAATLRARIATLAGSAQRRLVALAALTARPVSALPPLRPQPLPRVAARIPPDVRIDLIARRPDIVASRWEVDAARRGAESARAAFFPDVSVDALAGFSTIDLGKLLNYGSRVPQAGLALQLPIFDSGLLRARYGASRAALAAAIANYDQRVVAAARDVAAQAAALRTIGAERRERVAAVDAARRLAASAAATVRHGLADRRAEFAARITLLEQRDAVVQVDGAALSADIGLQRALGGGYAVAPTRQASTPPTRPHS